MNPEDLKKILLAPYCQKKTDKEIDAEYKQAIRELLRSLSRLRVALDEIEQELATKRFDS